MRFRYSLYSYQKDILEIFEKERNRGEKKIHIVAPPGAGKTIVGLEMLCRIDAPTLILVPNLTLQEQWKDKLEKLFLEEHESIEELVSTSISDIKKVNIITYQSLSGTDDEGDDIQKKILDIWFNSEKDEFPSYDSFLLFVQGLREENPKEYQESYTKHRKKLKESGNSEFTRKLMKDTIHEYVTQLRKSGVRTMVVDEAHHLTSWWSHVLYEIWTDLAEPYIIGLTATPPFDNIDYFELDESYTKLLGTVDYYVPTPAIVKSGRLAPYSDLVYIVSPDTTLEALLEEKEKNLKEFLALHEQEIAKYLHGFLLENFDRLKVKSLDILEKWIRFVYKYKDASIDMSPYITKNASLEVSLEDIAKSVGKWAADTFKKTKKTTLLDEVRTLFFDLGYIWRGMNLYRFETPIEKGLVYSKTKIEGVYAILSKEEENLDKSLRVAIITDFLDVESDWINGHSIFDEVAKKYGHLNPYLVSGQGIWKIQDGQKKLMEDETILSVTEKLSRGETRVVIGTRGILGEGWDCPAVNTLIDLTGVSAYMSVNQVHGRAIRIDPATPEKVANIYDIVCIGHGFQGQRDFGRLERKHAQFYGVDDSGLVIKELDHIYPQLEKFITQKEKINTYTLRKSSLRNMVKTLWNIGSDFRNEEVFSLSVEILKPLEQLYLPVKIKTRELLALVKESSGTTNLLELGNTTYHSLMRRWIDEILHATLQVMKPLGLISEDFSYTMKWSQNGSIKITGNHPDEFTNKKFLEMISSIFHPVTDEKYLLKGDDVVGTENLPSLGIFRWIGTASMMNLVLAFVFGGAFILFPLLIVLSIVFSEQIPELLVKMLFTLWISFGIIFLTFIRKYAKKVVERMDSILPSLIPQTYHIGLPDIVASNEEKRQLLIGKRFNTIPEDARWYTWLGNKYHFLLDNPRYLFTLLALISGGVFIYLAISPTAFPIIQTAMLSILFGVMVGVTLFMLLVIFFNIIHAPYRIYAKLMNTIEREKIVQLPGKVIPTTQDDIGKEFLLSAKIEKLWI